MSLSLVAALIFMLTTAASERNRVQLAHFYARQFHRGRCPTNFGKAFSFERARGPALQRDHEFPVRVRRDTEVAEGLTRREALEILALSTIRAINALSKPLSYDAAGQGVIFVFERSFTSLLSPGCGRRRAYLGCDGGNVSPLFALLIIPLIGVIGLGVEAGNALMQQRLMQHAADSGALAAAFVGQQGTTVADTVDSPSILKRYVRDALAATKKYNLGVADTDVVTERVACPDPAAGTNCYQTKITRTLTMRLTRLVGLSSMTPISIAQASIGTLENDCFIGAYNNAGTLAPPGKDMGIYLNGSNSGLDTCTLRSYGPVDCSNSVTVAGVNAPSSACGSAPFFNNTAAWDDPYDLGSYKLAASAIACSASINNLDWATVGTAQYARLCSSAASGGTASDVKITANLDISSTSVNRVLYLDGIGINFNGKTLSATNTSGAGASHTGTTIIATNNNGPTLGGAGGGSSGVGANVILDGSTNGSTFKVLAPGGAAGGATANFVFIADPTVQPSSANQSLLFGDKNNKMDLDIIGVIYAPWSDIYLNGSSTTQIGSYSNCFSLIGNAIESNGGKLTLGGGTATSGCDAAGITTPKDFFGRPALVK
jgi:Flp pilus assembly protein TadG